MNYFGRKLNPQTEELHWFGPSHDEGRIVAFGLRLAGGGAHQSRTMMLRDIGQLLSQGDLGRTEFRRLILDENILGRPTAAGRVNAFRHLSHLYGLAESPPLTKALVAFAAEDRESLPLLAFLAALAREPLLRDTAQSVLAAQTGVVSHGVV